MESYIDQIDSALADERTLCWIEDHIIDPAPLDDDYKAALWLYAWVKLPRVEHEQIVRDLVF